MFDRDSDISRFIRLTLPTLSVSEKKALVTLCRAQYVPSGQEARLLSFQCFGTSVVHEGYDRKVYQAARSIKNFIESPIWSGYILDICRASMLSLEEVGEQKGLSWHKELAVMNGTRRSSSLNYAAIFDAGFQDESLIPGVEPNSGINHYIHSLLNDWKDWMADQLHYPRMTSKRSSRATERQAQQIVDWRAVFSDKGDMFSQCVMTRIYADTGIQVQGPCEARQKWYRSGIVPRTYYAQGGSSYFSSCHLQAGFNKLVDMLPTSNHVLRLLPTNLDVSTPGSYAFIYDLSSFTSNFHEHEPFMRELAEFCMDTEISILDAHSGIRHVNLGAMLRIYCDINLSRPEYSLERYHSDFEHEELVAYHEIAGFLGVFGNLMTCTFLHSVVVLCVLGEIQRLYTAGDDGGAVVFMKLILDWGTDNAVKPTPLNPARDDVMLVFYAILLLGSVAWSKVFISSQMGAIALKRPLYQIDRKLYTPLMLIWPQSILVMMFESWGNTKDPRFSDFYLMNEKSDLVDAIATEIFRFQKQVFASKHLIVDEGLRLIFMHLTWVYERVGFPLAGHFPQCHLDPSSKYMIPRLMELADLSKDPIRRTLDAWWSGQGRVPCRVGLDIDNMEEEFDMFVGSEFDHVTTKLLSYLRKTRYVLCDPILINVFGESSYDRLLQEYSDDLPLPLYHYKVLSLPSWL